MYNCLPFIELFCCIKSVLVLSIIFKSSCIKFTKKKKNEINKLTK